MPTTSAIIEALSGTLNVDVDIFKLLVAFFFACFPAYIWGYLYYQKQPEPRKLVTLTFIAGVLSVIPLLIYKGSWSFFPGLNIFLHSEKLNDINISFLSLFSIPLGVILVFMFVGVIEEYMKHFAVKMVDQNKFKSIDDAIEYSIIASLGFSFIENIMYFYFIWVGQGNEQFFIAFIFRSIFSTFAHILFSGMYGYFYGIAYFSDPVYQQEIIKNRCLFTRWLHRLTNIRSEKLFHEEKIIEGLLVAVALHAVFDIFLEIGWTYVIFPYLVIGYLVLDYLFDKKDDHVEYGRVSTERTSES